MRQAFVIMEEVVTVGGISSSVAVGFDNKDDAKEAPKALQDITRGRVCVVNGFATFAEFAEANEKRLQEREPEELRPGGH